MLPQLPQDPGSGAARSLHTICEMLADSGFAIRVLATTASELAQWQDAAEYLRAQGLHVTKTRTAGSRPELVFQQRGISYRLLDTARSPVFGWSKLYGRQFDLMFDDELKRFAPDILFTYGGTPEDLRRRRKARRCGVKVVFGLRNLGYLAPGSLDEVDAILAASRFLADKYRDALGVESTTLPPPMDMEDVLAEDREPIFVTMINPSMEKGVMVFARIAEEVSRRRPTVALMVIESRGSAGMLAAAALAGGFDLRRHQNILVSAAVPKPQDIYAGTRVLLVPSVVEDAAARVVAEALVNGIPPIVSGRGGLAEVASGGGFVLPIPAEVTMDTRTPPDATVVEPWVELILRLTDDHAFYEESSARALQAGRIYRRESLAPRYVEFFERVLTQ